MCRDRAWRRDVEKRKMIKRLKFNARVNHYCFFESVNGFTSYNNIRYIELIKKSEYCLSKTISTPNWASKIKSKFNIRKTKYYWYRRNECYNTKEYRRKEFLKILKENGIK